jgi:hypothetical protein
MIDEKKLDELDTLNKHRSPGPWSINGDHFPVCSFGNSSEDGQDYGICMNGYAARDGYGDPDAKNDAEFVQAMENSASGLLRLARIGLWAEKHSVWNYLKALDESGEYRSLDVRDALAELPKRS